MQGCEVFYRTLTMRLSLQLSDADATERALQAGRPEASVGLTERLQKQSTALNIFLFCISMGYRTLHTAWNPTARLEIQH